MTIRRVLPLAVICALLAGGCGGGGGGGGSAIPDSTPPPSATGPAGGGTGSSGGAPGAGTTPAPVARSAAFQVNTSAAGAQQSPALAALADGGYVVAWHRDDAQGNGIFARRFAADGSPVGDEIR